MPENNIWDPNPPPEENRSEFNKKPMGSMVIVAWNLLALAIYTLLATVSGGFIIDAFFLFFHVLLCLIVALADRNWFWLLCGLLVLVIGFSTCSMLANSFDGFGLK